MSGLTTFGSLGASNGFDEAWVEREKYIRKGFVNRVTDNEKVERVIVEGLSQTSTQPSRKLDPVAGRDGLWGRLTRNGVEPLRAKEIADEVRDRSMTQRERGGR